MPAADWNITAAASIRCSRSGAICCGRDSGACCATSCVSSEAPALLSRDAAELTLGEYLVAERYSREFIDHYLVPMGAAIWSTDPRRMLGFPARFFVRFFTHHGMLTLNDRPQWQVIRGGSDTYLGRLTAGFRERIRLSCPVREVTRRAGQIFVSAGAQGVERFDALFIACHSDEALALLGDADCAERAVLALPPRFLISL